MKELLQNKLNSQSPYTDHEISWCLDNIGHPDPAIRDEVIYNSFCHGFEHHLISPEQFIWLANNIHERELLTHTDTLTRSFSALLTSLLISCDNWQGSPYFSLLENSRAPLFELSLNFLTREKDTRGYDNDLGWIHAIAHGAELLLATSLHDNFPKERLKDVWQAITTLLYLQISVFSAGEADRLAMVISQLLLSEKLTQTVLAQWISELNYSEQEPEDYFCSLNIKSFLATIYLTCEKEGILTAELKQAIFKHY